MSKEFVRQIALDPDHFERRRGLMGRMHLDPWLLLLLVGVMGFGLVVLFSASDNSSATVEAQLLRMGVAFAVMLEAHLRGNEQRQLEVDIRGEGLLR